MTSQYTFFALLLLGCAATRTPVPEHYTVLESVNVVDVVAGELRPAQTVVLRDSLIHYVGDAWTPPPAARVTRVDGTGQYLIPGLWDMHFHLSWLAGNDTLLFPPLLANGITGVRDLGGDLAIQRRLKQRVSRGEIAGPALIGAGPILDGNPPVLYDFSLPLDDASDLPHLLDSLIAAGSDFFKVYSLLREPELREIAAFAESRRVPFAGHLSEYVEPEVSIGLGQRSIEHLNRLDAIWRQDSARLARIAAAMLHNGTWLCPTLVVYERKVSLLDSFPTQPAYERYIPSVLREEWIASRERRRAESDSTSRLVQRKLFTEQLALVRYLHERGVPILAGSDFAGAPYIYPGSGLHEELRLLQRAGLSPAAVLRAATLNPARYFGYTDRYGTIAPGRYADLVVLTRNPLEDIGALATIERVFRKGKTVYP